MSKNLTIVNIVGSGKINSEADLHELAEDLSLPAVYIEGPGLYLKFHEDGPTVVLARSGKYFISGASSHKELQTARTRTLELFADIGLIEEQTDLEFSVKNVVFTYDVGEEIRLSKLSIHAGLENIEYEPEQFPGLVYRPKSIDSVALIFNSGKTVVTGVTEQGTAKRTIDKVHELLTEMAVKGKN